MSEYLSKKAVLEWFGLMHLEYSHNAAVSEFIESGIEIFESGAFDADDSEVKRLREALHKITQIYDDPNLHDLTACHEMNRVAKEAISTTIEPTGPYTVRRDVTAGINTKGQPFAVAIERNGSPEQHLMWKIKSLLENWDFRAIASELESGYDQGVLVELVELCEMLTGAKSPRVNWLDQKDANAAKVERFECPCWVREISGAE